MPDNSVCQRTGTPASVSRWATACRSSSLKRTAGCALPAGKKGSATPTRSYASPNHTPPRHRHSRIAAASLPCCAGGAHATSSGSTRPQRADEEDDLVFPSMAGTLMLPENLHRWVLEAHRRGGRRLVGRVPLVPPHVRVGADHRWPHVCRSAVGSATTSPASRWTSTRTSWKTAGAPLGLEGAGSEPANRGCPRYCVSDEEAALAQAMVRCVVGPRS
jgi:hypothetical protein